MSWRNQCKSKDFPCDHKVSSAQVISVDDRTTVDGAVSSGWGGRHATETLGIGVGVWSEALLMAHSTCMTVLQYYEKLTWNNGIWNMKGERGGGGG